MCVPGNVPDGRACPSSGEPGLVHTRIRPFNTLGVGSEEDQGTDLAHAVVAGNIVFLRGQVGQDLETGESVGVGDAAVQADCAMRNAEILLKECGSDLGHICKIVVYLVDPRLRDAVYPVIGRWLKGVHPVSTGVVVSMLGRPEWLVEIDIIAVKPKAAGARGRRAARRR